MSDELNNGALRLAVAQICQSMGWDALNKSTHDLLTEVLQKYMMEIAKCANDYSQLYCHTEPSLDDLGLAFKHTGVLLHELEDFVSQVDQVPFNYQLPQFPMPKPSLLQHSCKEDIIDRPEFYHEHLPPLVKALQQNEDEREGDKDESRGIEDPSSQSFLRNEIKTIGKETENESTENTPNKRSHTISSPEADTDTKRRRMEGKHSTEKKLDILQVLQEKNNSNSLSPSPSPEFTPIDTEKSEKSLFNFSSTSTPTPKVPPPDTLTPKKVATKKDKPSKDKKLMSPPSSQMLDQKQFHPEVSPKSTEKKSSKTKAKPVDSPSKAKKTSTTEQFPSSPCTVKPLQETFPKPKTPKKSKVKQEKPVTELISSEPVFPKTTYTPPVVDNSPSVQAKPMPKLIIKPMKLEKNLHSEYSISSAPFDNSLGPVKKKTKIKVTPSSSATDEAKPKKKKKKKDVTILGSTPTEQTLLPKPLDIALPVVNTPAPAMENVGEINIKKKKKKHKEKDRDKTKPKKLKEPSSEPSIPAIPTIPTIKLKLENTPTTTISNKDIHSTTKIAPSTEPTVVMPKEEMTRTVITETLSTTVQIYYCPACSLPDDGSFMIGCDTCDSWYHGACVGIVNDPGGDWFCDVCRAKKAKKKKKKKKAKV